MVRLRTQQTPGPVVSVLGLLLGLGVTGIGVGSVVRYHDDPFSTVWSSLMLVFGLIVLISYVALLLAKRARPSPSPARDVTFEDERARFFPRNANPGAVASNFIFLLLGGWFLALGIVGAVDGNWIWPVLVAFPAAYFLGFPVLRAVGRFRSGGVWVTETRIVDEHLGLRREIALANVKTAFDVFDAVRVEPEDPSSIRYKRLTPRLWCARLVPGEMLIQANGLAGGPEGFAAEVRERAVAAQSEPKRRWWGR
ncbi:hypothetical protein ABTX24_00865 [Nocardioides sp. NPDC127514]|uniref:hypothetical protein n=1 Tax=unclassified Nocardioides TaxID=2615069 RepID=UPI003316F7A7